MSVKSKLMQMAREQFAESDANLNQEQIDAGLNDAAVTAEVNAEVVAPLGEIDQGLADVEASVADADALAANADRLEQAADTGGVDPLTADIVSDQVAAAQERWLGVTSTFRAPSRESFNTSSGKVAATRAIVTAAREADKSIKDQAMDAIKAAIKWLVNIVKQAFSKHERLLARASALAESAATLPELVLNDSREGARNVLVTPSQRSWAAATWSETMSAVRGSTPPVSAACSRRSALAASASASATEASTSARPWSISPRGATTSALTSAVTAASFRPASICSWFRLASDSANCSRAICISLDFTLILFP
jgi:hypothetical protein